MDVHLDTARGLVTAARVFSDSLRPDMIERVGQVLVGTPYRGADLAARVRTVGVEDDAQGELSDLATWLEQAVERG